MIDMKYEELLDKIRVHYQSVGHKLTREDFMYYLKERGIDGKAAAIVQERIAAEEFSFAETSKKFTLQQSEEVSERKANYCQNCGAPTSNPDFICENCKDRVKGRRAISTRPLKSKSWRRDASTPRRAPSSDPDEAKKARRIERRKLRREKAMSTALGKKEKVYKTYTMSYGPRGEDTVTGEIIVVASNNKEARKAARKEILEKFGENSTFKEIVKKVPNSPTP